MEGLTLERQTCPAVFRALFATYQEISELVSDNQRTDTDLKITIAIWTVQARYNCTHGTNDQGDYLIFSTHEDMIYFLLRWS